MFQRFFSNLGVISAGVSNTLVSPVFCRQCISHSLTNFANGSSRLLLGQNANQKLQLLINNISVKLNLLNVVLTQQCNRVAALRLRRAYQILLLYQRIYGEQVLMQKIKSHVRCKSRPLLALLSATVFQWEKERVSDEELQKCTEEMENVNKLVELSHRKQQGLEIDTNLLESNDWEQLVDRNDFKIWRRLLPDAGLYQYRVFGHFSDIPPRAFYNTQVDLGYWKDWDKNTVEVKIIDKDVETDSEVVHWVYRFPYPMYPRDYVYVRRCKVDANTSTMVITARATEHPSCPETDSCVRVATYCSQMVIKPDTTFEENGFDYVMTYFDDPKTNFPPMCFNWMASTGVHEFLEKVHKAALKKHERSNESPAARADKTSGNIYPKMVHQ
ncbi:unnamed protein product [Candidula unifasciata]|uniref:Phosphatidylcholine transfer protein n=1 Tax=Candidula unifasciata TaxID=100452 RepID=A0A8S4A2F4_9EUPU|nr:unnamed protein product [Candidula unifasciata]